MKAHFAKLSLALLSTVFLLGCQEQGPGPVGPDTEIGGPNFLHQKKNPKPHGGGGGDPAATLDLADGMVATDLPVEVSKDTRKTLKVSNHNLKKPTIEMDFVGLEACVGFASTNGGTIPVPVDKGGDGTFERLVLQLTEGADDAKLVMSIEKANLDLESGHALIIQYDDVVLGNTYIMLGGWPGPVKVEEDPADVFTFTGPVVVWDPNGGINDENVIRCPGQTVVVTLSR